MGLIPSISKQAKPNKHISLTQCLNDTQPMTGASVDKVSECEPDIASPCQSNPHPHPPLPTPMGLIMERNKVMEGVTVSLGAALLPAMCLSLRLRMGPGACLPGGASYSQVDGETSLGALLSPCLPSLLQEHRKSMALAAPSRTRALAMEALPTHRGHTGLGLPFLDGKLSLSPKHPNDS